MQKKLIKNGNKELLTVSSNPDKNSNIDLISALISDMPYEELFAKMPALLTEYYKDGSLEDAEKIVQELETIDLQQTDNWRSHQKNFPMDNDSFYRLSSEDAFKGLRYMRMAPSFLKQFPTMESFYRYVFGLDGGESKYYMKKMKEQLKAGYKGLPYTIELHFEDEDMTITKQEYRAFCEIFSLQNLYKYMQKGLVRINILSSEEHSGGHVYYANAHDYFGGKCSFDVAIKNVYTVMGTIYNPTTPYQVANKLWENVALRPNVPIKRQIENALPYNSILDPVLLELAVTELAGAEHPSLRKMAAVSWLSSSDVLNSLSLDEYSGTASFGKATAKIPKPIKEFYKNTAAKFSEAFFSDRNDAEKKYSFVGLNVFLNLLFSIIYYEEFDASERNKAFLPFVQEKVLPSLDKFAERGDFQGFKDKLIAIINSALGPFLQYSLSWVCPLGSEEYGKHDNRERYEIIYYSFGPILEQLSELSEGFDLFHEDYLRWEEEYHEYIINKIRREGNEFWQEVIDENIYNDADPTYWLQAGERFYKEFTRKYGEELFAEAFAPDFLKRFREETIRGAKERAKAREYFWEKVSDSARDQNTSNKKSSNTATTKLKMSTEEALELFGFSSVEELNLNNIKARFRKLSMRSHPDKHKQEIAADPKMADHYNELQLKLQEARAILENLVKD